MQELPARIKTYCNNTTVIEQHFFRPARLEWTIALTKAYCTVSRYNEKEHPGDATGKRAKEAERKKAEGGEEEGRQTILAKDRRYSNAFVVGASASACTEKHFCRLPWLQDNRHFFPPLVGERLPFSSSLRPFRPSCARLSFPHARHSCRESVPSKNGHPLPPFAYITELYYSLSGNIATR